MLDGVRGLEHLQATTVGVNWDEKQMEDLPYGRGIRGLARLVPGLSPTQFDVGGNTVGGSTTTGARSCGRARAGSTSTASCRFAMRSMPTLRRRTNEEERRTKNEERRTKNERQ